MKFEGGWLRILRSLFNPSGYKTGGIKFTGPGWITVSADTETSCQSFLYQSRTISTRIPQCTTLGKPYANLALNQANTKNYGVLAQRPFFTYCRWRNWNMADFAKLCHCEPRNFDVEYYHFDYQFYKRIQLRSVLVGLYIKCSNSLLRS